MADDWTKERIDAVLAEVRAKHPDAELVPVVTARGLFVLRTPSHPEYTMFRKQATDEASRHMASESIIATISVFPADAGSVIRRWPGLATHRGMQSAFSYLCGQADEVQGKG